MTQPLPTPIATPPPDTRSFWQKHHFWSYFFGALTVASGLGGLSAPIAALGAAHAAAVVAAASGAASVIVTAHQQAAQKAAADQAATPAP